MGREPWHGQPARGKGGLGPSLLLHPLCPGAEVWKCQGRARCWCWPRGKAPWAVALLQSEEGPHYLQPLTHLPPSFWQIPSQLVLHRDHWLQTQSSSSGNWGRPGSNSIAPNSQRFPPLGIISNNSGLPWACLIQAPEVLLFLQHSPAPEPFLCQSCTRNLSEAQETRRGWADRKVNGVEAFILFTPAALGALGSPGEG